ncbi:hypothetical protein VTJ83DRAFT_6588 [Remersonia thermophila]|uniref:Uncharacterized protein n=1 Tax=Remersonia thermophila TaxID=72144 RepID=A0ABR4D551_9PEZI
MVDLSWNHFGPVPGLDPEARAFAERIYYELKAAFPAFVADFESKFGVWRRRWFDVQASSSADSVLECCELPEYDAVLLLGPKTIPLVVYELCNPQNSFATVLYNHLETDPAVKVSPKDVLNYLTLDRQANLIVELNHERAQQAQAGIEAWRRQTQTGRQRRAVEDKTCHVSEEDAQHPDLDMSSAEHAALVGMGPGIVAHIMLAYAADRSGPWWRVMHQLVCEKPAAAVEEEGDTKEGEQQQQYERWRRWFEHMEHHEAAEGLNPEYLRRMGMPAASGGM